MTEITTHAHQLIWRGESSFELSMARSSYSFVGPFIVVGLVGIAATYRGSVDPVLIGPLFVLIFVGGCSFLMTEWFKTSVATEGEALCIDRRSWPSHRWLPERVQQRILLSTVDHLEIYERFAPSHEEGPMYDLQVVLRDETKLKISSTFLRRTVERDASALSELLGGKFRVETVEQRSA